jgi:hypothetical protein
MSYDELYTIWHTNFISECKLKNINLEKFLFLTDLTKTNGCCYFKGTKRASAKKLLGFCIKLNIPPDAVFFHKPIEK